MNPILWLGTASGAASISALAWTLVHFLWEGVALALLLYIAIGFSRSSRIRYALAVSTLAAMLLAPAVTFVVLRQQPAGTASLSDAGYAIAALKDIGTPIIGSTTSMSATLLSSNWLAWLVVAWLGGVLVFSTRALGGWVLLARLRRKENSPLAYSIVQRCSLLEQRVGLSRPIRYLQSKLLEAPAVIGWFRPAVLIPAAAIAGLSPQQLEAVIAHELAHIKRLDCFVNLFQIGAEALLFYHPAIWWVNRVIRAERENCCDDIAVSVGGDPVEYAKALTVLEFSRATPTWALAATGGNLKKRVSRLLGKNVMPTVPAGGLAAIGILFAAGVLFATTSMKQPVARPSDPAPSFLKMRATQRSAGEAGLAPTKRTGSVSRVSAWPAIAMAAPPFKEQSTASTPSGSSYIEGLRSAGLTDLSVDQLIALKIQGVTPAYINGLRAAGLNPKVNEIIAMKVQGVTPTYIKEIRADGLNPNMHEIIAMKVQGIDPAYIKAIRATGLNPNMHEIIAMKVQGITPEFVEKVRSHGFKNLNVHQLIELKNAGIF